MPEPVEYEAGVYRRLQEIITAREARITELEAAIRDLVAMYAASPNDDDWQHKAVKHARTLVR